MSSNLTCQSFSPLLHLLLHLFLTLSSALGGLHADPDPAPVQPFLPTSSPPTTIPAFPEQSDATGCPLNLSNDLFSGIKAACGAATSPPSSTGEQQLQKSRCCPVLAAWLYAAYSGTALKRAGGMSTQTTAGYDMPLLPDDSEACVDDLEKELEKRGVELARPNQTCDLIYCYCGIRLHPVSCPAAFSVSEKGNLVGDESVRRLERECKNGNPGLDGCTKCLNSLSQLKGEKQSGNRSRTEEEGEDDKRSSKMKRRECEVMGLTWLLSKNRTAYFHTVSAVLRTIMMSADGPDDDPPRSCNLTTDGMPLAVDSSEISGHSSSSSTTLHYSSLAQFFMLLLLIISTV